MSMSVGSHGEDEPMMEMNTTQLIDVMLVLLIMFIITIPIQTHAVKIDLPPRTNKPPPPIKPNHNDLIITNTNQLLWNGAPINEAQLADDLEASKHVMNNDGTLEPELRFAPVGDARYDYVDYILSIIKASKIKKFGFANIDSFQTDIVK
ncbi:MAG: biopolymer transporter ExbD [Alphaproteobacteria bacterium]|nr:biopolymer transporter ExbD [Alphaproteobacteria bacterium]